jgi:hypothetical protein
LGQRRRVVRTSKSLGVLLGRGGGDLEAGWLLVIGRTGTLNGRGVQQRGYLSCSLGTAAAVYVAAALKLPALGASLGMICYRAA